MRLVQTVAGDALYELVVGDGITIAEHHRGDLSVDDRARNEICFMPADFDVLPRSMENLGNTLVCHQFEERLKLDALGERVDDKRLVPAGHLSHAQMRIIAALAQEFGVDRDEGMLRHPRAGLGQLRGGHDGLHAELDSAGEPICQARIGAC